MVSSVLLGRRAVRQHRTWTLKVMRLSLIETASHDALGQLFTRCERPTLSAELRKRPHAIAPLKKADVQKQDVQVAGGEPKRVLNRCDLWRGERGYA